MWLKGCPFAPRHLTQGNRPSGLLKSLRLRGQPRPQTAGLVGNTLEPWELGPFYFIGSACPRLAHEKARSQPGPNTCGLQLLVYKEGDVMAGNTKGFARDKVLYGPNPCLVSPWTPPLVSSSTPVSVCPLQPPWDPSPLPQVPPGFHAILLTF